MWPTEEGGHIGDMKEAPKIFSYRTDAPKRPKAG